jgi:hypothetical protein
MTRYRAVAARMGRQQPQRPQFVRVTSFLGLRAGLADQPSPRRLCNVRRASRTRQVVDCLKRSHRGNPSGAACNPLAVNTERCGGLPGTRPHVANSRQPTPASPQAGSNDRCTRETAKMPTDSGDDRVAAPRAMATNNRFLHDSMCEPTKCSTGYDAPLCVEFRSIHEIWRNRSVWRLIWPD